MKKLALLIGLLVTAGVHAGETTHWGYSGHEGPDYWGELSPRFIACATGKNQSPIDLSDFIESELEPIGIDYQTVGTDILNNGHTVQVNFAPGSKISIDAMEFELKQYHFHTPSENHINGISYPLEAHLVHADKDGNLAVVAVMFVEGEANASLADAWAQMPEKAGDKHALQAKINADGILPADRDYYRFNGSLTTPPCTEGVRWLVMKQPVTASAVQIGQFSQVMHHPNNRPVQAVNARPVLQ